MNIGRLKVFSCVIIIACSAVFLSASADTFDETTKKSGLFYDWGKKYLCMGEIPTVEEVRAKQKVFSMTSEQAKDNLDSFTEVNERTNNDMFNSCMHLFAVSSNLVVKASNSKYQGTRLLARDMTQLLRDIPEERKKRDAEAFWLTTNKISDLSQIIADRIDAEGTIENIRKNIPAAINQSQLVVEHEIRTSLETFATNENDSSFQPKEWVKNLLDTKVNPYIARWNTDAARN